MSKETETGTKEGAETSTGDSGNEGGSTETEQVSELQSKVEELTKQLNGVNAANARLSGKVKTYEDKTKEAERAAAEKAEKDGDHEKTIEFLKKEKGTLEEQVQSLSAKLESTVIDTELLSTAVKIGCKKPEIFVQVHRDKFELGETEDGKAVTKLKGTMAEVLTPEQYLSKQLDEHFPEWKENQRAAGTGTGEKRESTNGDGANVTFEKFQTLEGEARRTALKDPELRNKIYSS